MILMVWAAAAVPNGDPRVGHCSRIVAKRSARVWRVNQDENRVVAQADVIVACFDSKYHYNAWRPRVAIPQADLDDNAATTADATWLPFVPTPNHPEYPAAHTCADGALAEVLNRYFGTKRVSFDVNSTVTGTTRHYDNTDAYVRDIALARIYGGMHFRTSTADGAEIGTRVARWVMRTHFRPLHRDHDGAND